MNKLNLIWIFALFLPFASAYSIEPVYPVNKTYFNFSVLTNEKAERVITLKNTGNFSIYNITGVNMYPYNFTQSIQSLASNQQADLTFSILTNAVFDFTPYFPTISFNHEEQYVEPPKSNKVIIDSSAFLFNPRNITINVYDQVCWNNTDVANHSIESINPQGLFSYLILPNQSVCFNLTQERSIEYYDSYTGKNGHLVVISNIKKTYVHNSQEDQVVSIHIQSKYPVAQVEIENYISKFEIPYDGEAQGVFRVLNKYNQTIHFMNFNISYPIDAEAVFTPNNFNLNISETRIINYKIKPRVKKTDQTNKSYDFNLLVQADNIVPITSALSIYINKHIFELNGSDDCININELEQFCQVNPNSIYCRGLKPVVVKENVTVYIPKVWIINVSQDDWDVLLAEKREGINAFDRIVNRYEDTEGIVSNQTKTINDALELCKLSYQQCANYQPKYEKLRKTIWALAIVIGILVFLGTITYIIFNIIKKGKKRKNELEGYG